MFLEFPEVWADDVLHKVIFAEEVDVCPCFWSVRVVDDVAADSCADRSVIVGDLVLTEAGDCSEESAFALPCFADNRDVEGVA